MIKAIMLAAALVAVAPSRDVDVALVLAVDTSESVDNKEFALQRHGLAAAFANPELAKSIEGGALGRIAVTVIDFSSQATVVVPWTVIYDLPTAEKFAAAIGAAERSTSLGDSTSVANALNLAAGLLGTMPYRATRRVIDVSGDGSNNTNDSMDEAQALVKKLKITVNGLPILDDEVGVEDFYRHSVLAGPGAFLIPAANSEDFARAIRRKLIREVS